MEFYKFPIMIGMMITLLIVGKLIIEGAGINLILSLGIIFLTITLVFALSIKRGDKIWD